MTEIETLRADVEALKIAIRAMNEQTPSAPPRARAEKCQQLLEAIADATDDPTMRRMEHTLREVFSLR